MDNFSEKMRQERLAYYEEDVDEINRVLDKFIETAQPRCVLMIDKEGHMITKKGFTQTLNTDSLAALVAGSFAATAQVAKLLGESEFSELVHQGTNENILVSLIGQRALAVILFDNRTTLGMVKVAAKQLTQEMERVMKAIAERAEKRGPGPIPLSSGYQEAALGALDDFFGTGS